MLGKVLILLVLLSGMHVKYSFQISKAPMGGSRGASGFVFLYCFKYRGLGVT